MLPIAKLPMPGPLGYGPHPRIKSGAGSSPLPRGEGTLHTPSKGDGYFSAPRDLFLARSIGGSC